jgi:GTP cyclohydrolase I
VLLKAIPFQSHASTTWRPIIGTASIAYLPRDKVVGISKLARVLHGFARRLQVQERLTAQVAGLHLGSPAAQGRGGRHRSEPRLHDCARSEHARRHDDD